MKQIPRETLAECLDLLEQGLSVEQILSRFPDESAGLRPFLETAVRLSRLAHAPSLAATRQSREAVLQEVDALSDNRSIGAPLWLWLRQALAPAVAFAILLLVFAVALPQVSASALPGDSLYGGKRLVERAQLFLASGPQRATLLARFNEERIREVESLLDSGRAAEVQFEGEIGEIEADYWTVAGVGVNLSEDTTIEGEPWPAGRALVQGRTQERRLLANRLVVFGEPPPALEPTPTLTATPSASATATPSPTPTVSPAPAETLQPLPSSTPAPPLSTTAPPLPSPVGDDGDTENNNDDDGNENESDDNANENDDDTANGDDDDNGTDNGDNDDGSQNDDNGENEGDNDSNEVDD